MKRGCDSDPKRLRTNRKASETTRGEKKNKRTVGETDVNEKIGVNARISRCRNKTNNISPSEWYRGYNETNTA